MSEPYYLSEDATVIIWDRESGRHFQLQKNVDPKYTSIRRKTCKAWIRDAIKKLNKKMDGWNL